MTPISVMLALHPVDEAASKLSASLEAALGQDGWFEKGRARDIWYLNLVHFTGPITEPNGLAQWVTARDGVVGLPVHAKTVEAVRWEFDGQKMVPRPLAAFPLDGLT